MEKMTKKDYFNELKGLVVGNEREVELIEFLDRQIELLSRKTSVKTKTQKENEVLIEKVYEALATVENPVTVTELQAVEGMGDFSNQKLSALLKKLVDAGRITKTTDKKKSYFSVNAE